MLRWAGSGKLKSAYYIFARKPKSGSVRNLGTGVTIIIKWLSRKRLKVGTRFSWLRTGSRGGILQNTAINLTLT
jgi:hypothetical protein